MLDDSPAGKTPRESDESRADASAYAPATVFRTRHYDRASAELIEQTARKLVPAFLLSLDPLVKRIEKAASHGSPGELLDLGGEAAGLARLVWGREVRHLGPEIIPLVVERLPLRQAGGSSGDCRTAYENLIGLLRWHAGAGAEALLDVFDQLDRYGQSLASVSLGLLGEGRAAGKIWDFYHRAHREGANQDWIGALWGLLDLEDAGLEAELAALLADRQIFPELFGFISRAGGEKAAAPLLLYAIEAEEDRRADSFMALVGIAKRLGQRRFSQLLAGMVDADADQEEIASMTSAILTYSEDSVREYFPIYYRGMQAADLQRFIS